MNAGMFGLPDGNAALLRPALVLLEERKANASAQLDFVNWYSPDYDEYEIHVIDMLQVNTGAGLYIAMRCSVDGGATFDSGNNYSHAHFVSVVAGAGSGGGNAVSFLGLISMGSTNANWGGSGVYHFANPPGSGRYRQLHGVGAAHDSNRGATDVEVDVMAGAYFSALTVNGLRFLVNAGASGNLGSGTIRIYGVAK
jgi:hypothetical protein